MTELIRLDIGCGGNKQEGWTGIDIRDMEGVDIVHDLEEYPWPLLDDIATQAIASHVVEHIKPWFSINFMDEVWRILLVNCVFAVSTPYPGSRGFWQDPTHCNGWNEATWQYFDPTYLLYGIYEPKPWKIRKGWPTWQANGNMEIIMEKLPLDHNLEVVLGTTLGIDVSETVAIKEKIG